MNAIDRSLFALACLAGLGILVLQLSEIAARLLGSSITFVAEASGFLMAALTFLALPEVTRRREHLVADFFVARMGRRSRHLVEAVLAPLATALCVAGMTFLMWGLARVSWLDGVRSEGPSRLPLVIPQAVVLVGLAAMLLRLVVQVVRGLRAEGPSAVPAEGVR
jgi:TRAP-type C4-dicarboxylate transport system permease small subunit